MGRGEWWGGGGGGKRRRCRSKGCARGGRRCTVKLLSGYFILIVN